MNMKIVSLMLGSVMTCTVAFANDVKVIDIESHNSGYDIGYLIALRCALSEIDAGMSTDKAHAKCQSMLKEIKADPDIGLKYGRPKPISDATTIKKK